MHKFDGIGLGEKLSFWFSEGEHDEKVSIHLFVDSCEMQKIVNMVWPLGQQQSFLVNVPSPRSMALLGAF